MGYWDISRGMLFSSSVQGKENKGSGTLLMQKPVKQACLSKMGSMFVNLSIDISCGQYLDRTLGKLPLIYGPHLSDCIIWKIEIKVMKYPFRAHQAELA